MIKYSDNTGTAYFDVPEYDLPKDGKTFFDIEPASDNFPGCLFDSIIAEEMKKPPELRQMVWHLSCPCPKCSVWC